MPWAQCRHQGGGQSGLPARILADYRFLGGYEGLLSPTKYRPLAYREMDAWLFRAGTILGTSNHGHFSAKSGHDDALHIPEEILNETCENYRKLGLRALEGTQKKRSASPP